MVMWSPGISLKECSVCVLSHSTCVHWHSSLQEGQLHIPYVLGSLHFHGLDCIALSLSLSLSPIIKLRDKYLGVVSHKATIYHWCRKHTLTSTTLCVHIHLPTCTHIHTYTHTHIHTCMSYAQWHYPPQPQSCCWPSPSNQSFYINFYRQIASYQRGMGDRR